MTILAVPTGLVGVLLLPPHVIAFVYLSNLIDDIHHIMVESNMG